MEAIDRIRVFPLALALSTVVSGCASPSSSEAERSQRIAELEEENTALREQVESLETRLAFLVERAGFHVSVDPAYPPIDASVLHVERNTGVVLLDKGARDGVKVGYAFSVYRGAQFKGLVKITQVEETVSFGVIAGEKSPIAMGDSATTSL